MSIAAGIRFLRDCYREDAVRGGYWNINATSVEHRVVFEGREQIVDDLVTTLAIPPGHKVDALFRDALLKSGEREFLYGSLFVAGRLQTSEDGAAKTVCSPLVTFPLTIDDPDATGVVGVEIASGRLNTALLDALADAAGVANFTDSAAAEFDRSGLGAESVLLLERLLRERVPMLDLESMSAYPQLLNKTEFRDRVKRVVDKGGLSLLAVSVAALWPKSDAARGILNELATMADRGGFSAPVHALLDSATLPSNGPGKLRPVVHPVPAVLSGAQKAILDSASKNVLSLAHGPPGTGKSFTIAAVALDHLSRSESVLIASRTDHAVNVIADKIERDFGVEGCLVRAGRANYLAELKLALENALAGVGAQSGEGDAAVIENFNENAALIDELQYRIANARGRELDDGRTLSDQRGGILQRFRRWWVCRRARQKSLPHVDLGRLRNLLDQHVESAGVVLERLRAKGLRDCLRRSRAELQHFLKALRSRRAARKEELFSELPFDGILDAFPIWLSKLSEVHRVLPLREQLFDLVIIDEATQCDIASCLPVLQRAKRVLIAGDARQLRHLSFLAKTRQARLAGEHGIPLEAPFANYRDVSVLDLVSDRVADQHQVGFLNEHYRSRPEIIAFSNARFYGGALHVMSEGLQQTRGSAIEVIRCSGTRDGRGVNQEELDRVLDYLQEIVGAELDRASDQCTTLGVLSPLRAQVEAFQDAIAKRFDSRSFARLTTVHQLRVATAYGFQGEERDKMFLSLAVGASGAAASLRFLSRPDVLNVAVTRAREAQYVFCSFDPGSLPPSSLLGEYLRFVDGGATQDSDDRSARRPDGFANEVSVELERLGWGVECGRTVAGTCFDLLATKQGRMVGIDLIGYPGLFEAALPIERYKLLQRAGVEVFPVAYTAWVLQREESLVALQAALGPC